MAWNPVNPLNSPLYRVEHRTASVSIARLVPKLNDTARVGHPHPLSLETDADPRQRLWQRAPNDIKVSLCVRLADDDAAPRVEAAGDDVNLGVQGRLVHGKLVTATRLSGKTGDGVEALKPADILVKRHARHLEKTITRSGPGVGKHGRAVTTAAPVRSRLSDDDGVVIGDLRPQPVGVCGAAHISPLRCADIAHQSPSCFSIHSWTSCISSTMHPVNGPV